MKTKTKRRFALNLEALEQRDTPSVSSLTGNNYLISIACNNNPSDVTVSVADIEYGGGAGGQDLYLIRVQDKTSGFDKSRWVNNSSATKIVFNGGSGADKFSTSTSFACTLKGNGGNDTLIGTSKADIIYGGLGNDTINGGGGSDTVYGDAGNDTIYGGEGNDALYGSAGTDTLFGGVGDDKLYGGTENDTLKGEDGRDKLYGEGGSDTLYGGNNNDALYGGTTKDYLYGEAGSDFLDDGSGLATGSGETNNGGDGADFLAYKPIDGTLDVKDVRQGSQNTCWILSSMISAANAKIDLKSRITYNGNGDYSVKLFNPSTKLPFLVHVNLEGGMFDFEPTPVGPESWVILFQRAILKQFTSNIADPSTYPWFATSPSQAMPYLTGRSASLELAGGTYIGSFGQSDIQKMANALAAGKLVCTGSRQVDYGGILPGVVSVASPYICGSHVYSVLSVDMVNKQITLRNPWGSDVSKDGNKILHNMQVEGTNDGYIHLSFNEFIGSFAMMSIS